MAEIQVNVEEKARLLRIITNGRSLDHLTIRIRYLHPSTMRPIAHDKLCQEAPWLLR